MSIIDSNARWEDEDKAMQAYLDEMDAEMAEVYDNEQYPSPAEEAVMDADLRLESADRALYWLEELDPDDWESVGAETGTSYQEELAAAKRNLKAAQLGHQKALAALKKEQQG